VCSISERPTAWARQEQWHRGSRAIRRSCWYFPEEASLHPGQRRHVWRSPRQCRRALQVVVGAQRDQGQDRRSESDVCRSTSAKLSFSSNSMYSGNSGSSSGQQSSGSGYGDNEQIPSRATYPPSFQLFSMPSFVSQPSRSSFGQDFNAMDYQE
jgi:hypothetical protein